VFDAEEVFSCKSRGLCIILRVFFKQQAALEQLEPVGFSKTPAVRPSIGFLY
jgi:hypothetical protein